MEALKKGHSTRAVLIVDPDQSPTTLMESSSIPTWDKGGAFKTLVAKNGKEAQLVISDRSSPLLCVVINPRVSDPSVSSVIRSLGFHRPATPFFISLNEHDKIEHFFPESAMSRLRHRKVVQKPYDLTELIDGVAPIFLSRQAQQALEKARENSGNLDEELSSEDARFHAIFAEDFLSGSVSFFDVYVRLSKDKYLKILQSGDSFEPHRIEGYLKKGLTHFYMLREAHETYVRYCDTLTTAILSSDKVSDDIKISQTLNHGEETFQFLKHSGLTEERLQYAKGFLKNVHSMIQNVDLTGDSVMKDFLNSTTAYEHGVGTSVLAGLLADALEIEQQRTAAIVGMAGFFHDIGLMKLEGGERWMEDEANVSSESRALFETHPAVGASILQHMKGFDPAVVQAVEQHHVRRDSFGFPDRRNYISISIVSEIVGICGEINQAIKRKTTTNHKEILFKLESAVFPGYSRTVVYAARSMFFPKLS